ncbi:MAG: trypsin-like peptidase domain-containing protein [Oscillospiraceae bacterium]|nr:trypsin-like peptidase domain-containing protein [Oscillospiraceae bacterium]
MNYFIDDNIPENNDPSPVENTDRVNGEYHYKNGYTQRIYSDAHYVRENETTAPPKYYTPPAEKPVKEPKPPKKKGGFIKTVCIVLVSAILGAIGGAAVTEELLDERMDRMEDRIEQLQDYHAAVEPESEGALVYDSATRHDNALHASQIYELALNQVVGITTEVTYTNFFGMTSSSAVTGSGFIVTSDGYILTNYHVIEDAYTGNLDVSVMLYDGTTYTAAIVGTEPDNDIAVLKIEAEGLQAAELADSDDLLVGDKVYAVGNPLGELEFSMTTGYVSAKDRVIATGQGSDAISMFQFDAAVNSGNSGGPVYNELGQVVGVVTAKYADTGVEGIGFAVPISDAASIANDLITKGYVTGKAYLGVSINSKYNSMYAQYYGWPVGAYVDSVTPGSCAETAGIAAGDIITKLGGEEIKSYEDLKSAIKRHSAGESVEVELYRADESRVVSVTFDESVPENA